MFRDGRVTDASVGEALRRDLEHARSLERIARRKGISVVEPFAGIWDGDGLFVLGPGVDYYESLLPHFDATPVVKTGLEAVLQKLAEAARPFFEALHLESLTDEGETSAENNSSVILLLRWAGRQALLTGDAGVLALTRALDWLDAAAPGARDISFVQVPHHGSRRNVGPTLLNRLLGPPQRIETAAFTAFVSGPPAPNGKHPSKRVTNAFRRRGAPVHATAGIAIVHQHNAPPRGGYGPISPLPFHSSFEE
jgi:hypothetical protein